MIKLHPMRYPTMLLSAVVLLAGGGITLSASESTTDATLRCASRATFRYSAMPLPGLGSAEPPDDEAHPPATHPSASDNASAETPAFSEEEIFMLVLPL